MGNLPGLLVGYIQQPIAGPALEALWQALERECKGRGDGCDVIAIPHNSNVSDGRMFPLTRPDGSAITAEDARRRAAIETLVEGLENLAHASLSDLLDQAVVE